MAMSDSIFSPFRKEPAATGRRLCDTDSVLCIVVQSRAKKLEFLTRLKYTDYDWLVSNFIPMDSKKFGFRNFSKIRRSHDLNFLTQISDSFFFANLMIYICTL